MEEDRRQCGTEISGIIFILFKRFYLFIFRQRGREGERGRETLMCGCLSSTPYWGPGPHPGMCPDWESNQQPFGSQASTQSSEPHQPRLYFFKNYCGFPFLLTSFPSRLSVRHSASLPGSSLGVILTQTFSLAEKSSWEGISGW